MASDSLVLWEKWRWGDIDFVDPLKSSWGLGILGPHKSHRQQPGTLHCVDCSPSINRPLIWFPVSHNKCLRSVCWPACELSAKWPLSSSTLPSQAGLSLSVRWVGQQAPEIHPSFHSPARALYPPAHLCSPCSTELHCF